MKYVRLGNSGLKVSPVCVGCMSYGDTSDPRFGWCLPEQQSLPILDACYKAGLNFFDTANTYSNGASEEILGKAIKKYGWRRENIVIATKCFAPVAHNMTDALDKLTENEKDNQGYVNARGLSRKHIFEACEASLKRLGLDYIDLYQIHRFDKDTPIEETMGALNDLVRAGKVRYIGASSMRAYQLCAMQYTAKMKGWTEFVTMQNLHHPAYREEENEMFPACTMFGIAGIPWSPLAMGYLARPHSSHGSTDRGKAMGGEDHMMRAPATDQDRAINEEIAKIAKERDTTMAVVCIAWCLSKPFVHSPIIGLSKQERIDEACRAVEFELKPDEIKRIDDLYKQPKPNPGWWA